MAPMNPIDRFTRDRASRYVWVGVTLMCALALFLAAQQQTASRNADVTNGIASAQAKTREIANTVLFTNLSYATMTSAIPAPRYRDVIVALASTAFTDTYVARVRVWRPDGTLQFSTHERLQVGVVQTEDKSSIDQALKGLTVSQKVSTPFSAASTGEQTTETNLLEVFVPLHVPDRISVAGVAEVDFYYDQLVQPGSHPWARLMIVFALLAALSLGMTLLSLRKGGSASAGAHAYGLGGSEAGDRVEPRRSGKHAVVPPSAEKAGKGSTRAAAPAPAAAAAVGGAELHEQLAESRDQLKQAEEAYHFLEAKWKRSQADMAAAEAAAEAAAHDATEIDEVREELARANAQIADLAGEDPGGVQTGRVAELEGEIASAAERLSAAEQRTREAEEAAAAAKTEAERSAEEVRAQVGVELAAAQSAAEVAEAAAAASKAKVAGTEEKAKAARAKAKEAEAKILAAEARAQAAEEAVAAAKAEAAAVPAPVGTPGLGDEAITQLEERIATAERRAGDAETLLEQVRTSIATSIATEAVDEGAVSNLRTRLARTASRKKMGHDGEQSLEARSSGAPSIPAAQLDLQRSMAGEIRAPLATLKGISLSLKGAVSTPDGNELVRRMNTTVKKLDRLAADLTEAADISAGTAKLNRRRTDLEALVSRVVGEADGLANLDVRMELDPASASVDPARVQQIVDGMVTHARERTSPTGTIRIRLTGDDDGATIAVDDEGAGVAAVGTQLALAAKLTELHGGHLWTEARKTGEGSSVKAFLPSEAPA